MFYPKPTHVQDVQSEATNIYDIGAKMYYPEANHAHDDEA